MSRAVLHLSDVHFGSEHARARAATILRVIETLRPDLVVVSGDLTQRARTAEFAEARAFLEAIRVPRVVVPGNHDVPLWNVARRLTQPLRKWRRSMPDEPTSTFEDAELAVVGIDTTRRFGVKGGHVGAEDLRHVEGALQTASDTACRIVVGHHPLDLPEVGGPGDTALGGRRALARLAGLGVELVLSGHLHASHAFRPIDRASGAGRPVLLVSAGTATSHRGRGPETHVNSFNLIHVRRWQIGVTTYLHTRSGTTYLAGEPTWFPRVRPTLRAHAGAGRGAPRPPAPGRPPRRRVDADGDA